MPHRVEVASTRLPASRRDGVDGLGPPCRARRAPPVRVDGELLDYLDSIQDLAAGAELAGVAAAGVQMVSSHLGAGTHDTYDGV